MSLMTRYLIRRISLTTLFTLMALVALFSFFDIINEASDLGKGHYTLGIMLVHVLLQAPGHVYELLPLAVPRLRSGSVPSNSHGRVDWMLWPSHRRA